MGELSSSISATMIVKNEEDYIEGCLNSIDDVVDQIVIVDTGCSDDTINIARNYEVDIFDFDWTGNFSKARNYAIEQAEGEWILHIDADERFKNSRNDLQNLLNNDTDAFFVKIRNYNSKSGFVKYSDEYQIRLFRNNPDYRFENQIHEQIAPSIEDNNGKVEHSALLIEHIGYINGAKGKAERNLDILRKAVENNSDGTYLKYKLGETYKALGKSGRSKKWLIKAKNSAGFSKVPNNIKDGIYFRLAQIELDNNNYKKAENYARKSLKFDSNNSVSKFVLSISLIYQNKSREALHYLEELKKRENNLDPEVIDNVYEAANKIT